MPIILIVDDSEVDRKLVAGLIKQDIEWIVEFAADGKEALETMEHMSPNLVITDLIMPNMDGMELVKNAQKNYPQIPIILVTGQGSESLAAEALRAGAASYVPKSDLADSLMDTVEQVLQLDETDASTEELMQCITSARNQFRLPSDPALIPPLINYVQRMLTELGLGDAGQRRHVGVALEEALINAMLHGNLELSKLQMHEVRRHMHEGTESHVVESRRQESPYDGRRILFGVDVNPQKAQFVIRDGGPGFDTSEMDSKLEPANLSSADGGRGLTLIGSFMDEVNFNESGNEIRMVLHANGQKSG
jgi:CheY-like chemotaxis protein/anti-sigma regulatory factor (Ser/Thr protein kinase)